MVNGLIKDAGVTLLYGLGGVAIAVGAALLFWWWRNRK